MQKAEGKMQKAEGRMQNAEAKTWRETAESHKPRKGDEMRQEASSCSMQNDAAGAAIAGKRGG